MKKDWPAIAFMTAWLVLWAAMILVAIYNLGTAALDGEAPAILFLCLWVGAACFGLWNGARRLRRLLIGPEKKWETRDQIKWRDGLPKDR